MVSRTTSKYQPPQENTIETEIEEYHQDLMEQKFIGISCQCGNIIRYADEWERGTTYDELIKIKCDKCGVIHEEKVNDNIIYIEGGNVLTKIRR